MIVTFSSDAGPIEGFLEATIRVGINDEGIGSLRAPRDVIDRIEGPISCFVDSDLIFSWIPEDEQTTANDDELIQISGRGLAAILERVIVLPVDYPNFTDRTRTEQGAPFAIWAELLGEGQARGRATSLTPSWTSTDDSNGDPWTETIDIRLEPGTDLRQLLDSVAEVEGAEWIIRPDGTIDAAPQLGEDRSDQVVLFYGRDQVSRERRSSSREQRQAIFVEASTGVSEALNSADPDAGEIWLEAQDYADPLSRQALANKLALKLGASEEEADVILSSEAGAFTSFFPGDLVGLDSGSGSPEVVRVVGITLSVQDGVDVTLEATLITEVELRSRQIERAIEAKADVRLAASPSIQRRHGLVTADKFLSGAVGTDVAISSENYIPGLEGWAILGNGDAEFNDAIFRGDLESNNYVEGISGWRLDQEGDAELNEGRFRGLITGSAFTTDDGTGAGHIVISGNPALDPESPGVNQIAFIPDASFFAPGSYALPALVQVLDTGGMALSSVAGSSGTDASVLLLRTNGIDLSSGPNGFQGIGISAPDGPIDLAPAAGLPVTINGNLVVTGTTALRATSTRALTADGANRDISGYRNISFTGVISGNGSGLTNLPSTPLPSDPTFNSVRVNTSLFFNTTGFPRFESSGSAVQLRGTGALRMKFDGGLEIEDGSLRFTGGTKTFVINRFGSGDLNVLEAETFKMFAGGPTVSGGTANLRVPTTGGAQWEIRRITSSRRYKQDIVDAPALDRLLEVVARHYRGIDNVEREGNAAPIYYGAIAEEVADLGLHDLVDYGDDGPEALAYDRIGLALIPHVRALRDRVDHLEEMLNGD
jgi:hypothetical protein